MSKAYVLGRPLHAIFERLFSIHVLVFLNVLVMIDDDIAKEIVQALIDSRLLQVEIISRHATCGHVGMCAGIRD